MEISSAFDGGNIEIDKAELPNDIRLKIRKDAHSDFYQWFCFRLTGAQRSEVRIAILNAGGASYPAGWEGYSAFATYDRQSWFRVPTVYDGESLVIRHRPEADVVWYAYFVPYSMERHADLIAHAGTHPAVRVRSLGKTLDGQDIDMIEIGGGGGAPDRKLWFIARQHPGETMAEWWMEGFLDRLLDADDPVARTLLSKGRFYIVPNMNPDGSRRGHLRTNAAGVNLNRAWNDPSLETSPEVFHVRAAMQRLGVSFHMDVHGDEAIPYNFIAGFEGISNATAKQAEVFRRYVAALAAASPDFQTVHGYPPVPAGTDDLRKCTDYVAATWGCPAFTLEMPFKDNADAPDPVRGWSPERSKHLARACLDALLPVIDEL